MKAIAHMEAWFLSCAALALALNLAFEHPQFNTVSEPQQVALQSALPDA